MGNAVTAAVPALLKVRDLKLPICNEARDLSDLLPASMQSRAPPC